MHILLVGEGPVASALVPMIELLGWEPVTANDHATAAAALPSVEAVIVTSHHDDVDGPVLRDALAAGTPYIGAMGSRKTQARRRAWLTENGLSEDAQAAIRGPAGLDIGAEGPAEIALSILAELVGDLRGRDSAGSISDRVGPIHPDVPTGDAYCPGG